MGGEQAGNVLAQISIDQAERNGLKPDKAAIAEKLRPLIDQFDRQSDALYASARLWDDGVIDPRKSRETLGLAFTIAAQSPYNAHAPNNSNIYRM